MWPNPQKNADLLTFTEEILNGKLQFLWNKNCKKREVLLEGFLRYRLEEYSDPSQICKMELLAEIVNDFHWSHPESGQIHDLLKYFFILTTDIFKEKSSKFDWIWPSYCSKSVWFIWNILERSINKRSLPGSKNLQRRVAKGI